MIKPHGKKLVNRVLSKVEKKEVLREIKNLYSLCLNKEKVQEVKNIANGVYSPLVGFLREKDFDGVVSKMRLSNNLVWTIPIVLDIHEKEYQKLKKKKNIILCDSEKHPVAILQNIEIYPNKKDFFAKNVYGTEDKNHPGVNEVYKMGNHLIGGEIGLLDNEKKVLSEYNFSPLETRKIFEKRRWKTVVAFQTRNVPHLGHEFLQKHALKGVDGLFIQPVIGEKKMSDFKDEFILTTYDLLIKKHYPKNKVFLGILPFKMRYAGPREAIFHALTRKNFGCTHFIVGRDHAGVGNYYGHYDAQKIFDNFKKDEIGIEILKYGNVIYCKSCQKHVFENECLHSKENKISFSGTEIRKSIIEKKEPPDYIMRPIVYHFLTYSFNPLVNNDYKNKGSRQKGFVVWFTGLSQAGKTTIGNQVYKILRKKGLKVERLDGDIIRQSLAKDLGFSKDDRNENIKRVGLVSKLLSKNGVAVIASFISPYRKIREKLKKKIPNFIEVFVNAPLEVCEKRDTKGLYQKAKKGEIQHFTGISDPYELPEKPEIELKTGIFGAEECAKKIIKYLQENKYI